MLSNAKIESSTKIAYLEAMNAHTEGDHDSFFHE